MSQPVRRATSGPRPPDDGGDDDSEVIPLEAPLAPTEEEWARMSPRQREAVTEALIASVSQEELDERDAMAEGDEHAAIKEEARDTLREFFRRRGMRIYVGSDIKVLYPGRKGFTPDIIVVLDVDPGKRDSWMVSAEGKGIDLALEIHWKGKRKKDFVDNVVRYAALGIQEYFAFDRGRRELCGWRLPPGKGQYQALRPHWGRLTSQVLDMDLVVEDGALRFHYGSAELLGGQRLVDKLNRMVDEAQARAEEEHQRAEEEHQRAQAERRQAVAALTTALLALLGARGAPVSEEQRGRIIACDDPELLQRWVSAAAQGLELEGL